MAIRIVGVDLPQNKRGEIALTYIFGIGRSSAGKILDKAGVDRDIKVKDWSDEQAGKIREVIGSGGKVINKIIADTGAQIDINDDGILHIATPDQEAAAKAMAIIKGIVEDPEVGIEYEGVVTRLMQFGAFVEFLPGKEGLVHISKMAWGRVENVEDAVKEGDVVKVKLTEVDSQGRYNLSMRDCMPKPEGYVEEESAPRRSDRPNRERRGGHGDRFEKRQRRDFNDNAAEESTPHPGSRSREF